MKKQNYEAPVLEQMEVRFEANIMSETGNAGAPGNMNIWSEQEF